MTALPMYSIRRRAALPLAAILAAACSGTPGWPGLTPVRSVEVCARRDSQPGRAPRRLFVSVTNADPRSSLPTYYLDVVGYGVGDFTTLADDSLRRSGTFSVRLSESGNVTGVHADSAGSSPMFDDSLASAIGAAGGQLAFRVPLRDHRESGTSLLVRETVRPDSVYADSTYSRVISLPGNRGPVYPSPEMSARRPGTVVARMMVNRAGRVEPNSIRILTASDSNFRTVVEYAALNQRMMPATINGCAVRQVVQEPFTFGTR